MLGSIVNAAAIIIGGILGTLIKRGFTKKIMWIGIIILSVAGSILYFISKQLKIENSINIIYITVGIIIVWFILSILLKNGLPKRYGTLIMQAVGLAVIVIGVAMALKSDNFILVIMSLVFGSIIGQWIDIEDKLEKIGILAEKKLMKKSEDNLFAKGFVTTSLIYCIGAMAITGALESGLTGDHTILFAKSTLDGVSAVVFASTMGIGVLFSFVPVFIYQGAITLLSTLLSPLLTQTIIAQMSAVGGCLIIAIGINILEIKKIKIGNMLPSVFIPLIYYAINLGIEKLF